SGRAPGHGPARPCGPTNSAAAAPRPARQRQRPGRSRPIPEGVKIWRPSFEADWLGLTWGQLPDRLQPEVLTASDKRRPQSHTDAIDLNAAFNDGETESIKAPPRSPTAGLVVVAVTPSDVSVHLLPEVGVLTAGRSAQCDIPLYDHSISRLHLKLY